MTSTTEINLNRLSEPFEASDIEWRVSRAGTGNKGPWCRVFCYLTARAIQKRLDEVCGPGNWQLTAPSQLKHEKTSAIGVGISIRIGGEWVTKWDVSELTDSNQNIPPFKGGFSGAMKRAGAQWGIGRYLYYLDETYAEVADNDPGGNGWHYAKLSKQQGGAVYYWKSPTLPAWALPKEDEPDVSSDELNELKRAWKKKFASDVTNRADLADGFSRFATSIVGEFPAADNECWTVDALEKCRARINETVDAGGISPDVSFEE